MAKTVSFQAGSDFTAEQAAIERQRAYAKMLQEQDLATDTSKTEVVGGWAIPRSPWESAAKAMGKVNAYVQDQDATRREKALAEELRKRTVADWETYSRLANGQAPDTPDPNDPGLSPESRGAIGGPGIKGDKQAALAFALSSASPVVQQMGALAAQPYTLKKDEIRYEYGRPVASNRQPEWKLGERWVDGKKQKFYYDANDPSNERPTGSAEGVSANVAAQLDQAERHWKGLSANQQQQLAMEAARLGISVQQLILDQTRTANTAINTQFTTGSGAFPAAVQPPAIPPVPQAGVPLQPGPQVPAAPQAAPAPQMPPQRPVAPRPPVAAPAPTRPAIPPGMTPAGAAELAKEAEKKRVEAQQALPKIIADAQLSLETIDQLVGKPTDNPDRAMQDGYRPHAGFTSLVGAGVPLLKYVPGSDTAGANRLHEQITGQAFLQAFEKLKGAGQITEIEGTKATNAITRMHTSQSEKDYVKAARELQEIIRQGIERARRSAGAAPNVLRFDAQGNLIQ